MEKYNDHKKLIGKHAYLGCSQYAWQNRTDEQLINMYYSRYASEIGTAVHAFAEYCIKNKIKLKKTDTNMLLYHLKIVWPMTPEGSVIPAGAYDPKMLIETVSLFVNDAIGFRMDSEVILAYSEEYAFGTADAFICDEKNKIIRVHDLKTGVHPVKMEQLLLYAAQYCLEYNKNPHDYQFILRVYQGGEIIEYNAPSDEIKDHMQKIVHAVDVLEKNIERF